MSTEFQLFFNSSPRAVTAEYGQPLMPQDQVQTLVEGARRKASDELRQQYEAQISDLRSEAIEFHQQLLGQVEEAARRWMREWERQVPELIFAGVRAVLADFELTDDQLHEWVRRTLAECGASDKSELEIRLSPKNVERLKAYWEEHAVELPQSFRLHAMSDYSEVECRVIGRRGILDASLPVRLNQLKRAWNLSE